MAVVHGGGGGGGGGGARWGNATLHGLTPLPRLLSDRWGLFDVVGSEHGF